MLNHLDDLESDFSAIHGISDMYSLPSRKFFKFAYRLPAYDGVMRVLVQEESEKRQLQGGGVKVGEDTYREVPSDAVATDPVLSEFIEMGEA